MGDGGDAGIGVIMALRSVGLEPGDAGLDPDGMRRAVGGEFCGRITGLGVRELPLTPPLVDRDNVPVTAARIRGGELERWLDTRPSELLFDNEGDMARFGEDIRAAVWEAAVA
jgi:hypothetical protein